MKKHLGRTILFHLLAFSILFVIIMVVSCQKTQDASSTRSDANKELNTQLMNSTNFALENENLDDQDFNDMIASDNMGENSDNVELSTTNDCKTVTYDPSKDVYPHTKTVVYNNCESECKGGTINGTKITYNYIDGDLAQPGDLIKETTYENLTVDSVKVAGDVKVYLVSHSPRTLHIVATRTFVIPGRDGTTETFNGDYTRTQIAGEGTNDNSDDVYAITGTANGMEILHGGTVAKYTSVIDTNDPLIHEHGCCWRTQGTETITIDVKEKGSESTLTEVLDYGDGACDNEATLTINGGEPQMVTLPLIFYPLVP
jgi:hypothetical protein